MSKLKSKLSSFKRGSLMVAAITMAVLLTLGTVYAMRGEAAEELVYEAQGMWQTIMLYAPNSDAALSDVSALRTADNYTKENPEYAAKYSDTYSLAATGKADVYAREGTEYFLNRIGSAYDITDGKDVQLQASFSAGVNKFSPENWKHCAMRYMSVINAETGKTVANWRDEVPDENGMNSSWAYQIEYSLVPGYTAVEGGILYTIPNAAFEYDKSYYVVFGSATCGNDNRKQLYAPVIFQITMCGADGMEAARSNVAADSASKAAVLKPHTINVNTVKSAVDKESAVDFNRYNGYWKYEIGSPVESSIVGQEIVLLGMPGDGLSSSWRIVGESGNEISINEFVPLGPSSIPYRDTRFTMPNEDVTINVVFGYKTFFYNTGDTEITGADIMVRDSERAYRAEKDGSYVLPAGEYTYAYTTAAADAVDSASAANATILDGTANMVKSEVQTGNFTVSGDTVIKTALTKTPSVGASLTE